MEKGSPADYSAPHLAPPLGAIPTTAPGLAAYPPNVTFTPTPIRVFGPNPQIVVCPSCNHRAATKVNAESSSKTHLMAALLCLACCCCIPYFVDSCKNKNHYCTSCGAYLGSYTN